MYAGEPPQSEEEFSRGQARQSSHARQKRTTAYGSGIGMPRRNQSSVGARNVGNNNRAGSKQRPSQYGYQAPQ